MMTNDELEKRGERMAEAVLNTIERKISERLGDKMPFQKAFDEAFDAVKGYIDRSFDAVHETLSDVEKRLSAVEAKANREEER
ncbi:hypothetical protein ACI2JN_07555 [Ochrobactrum teleogrylli]